MTQSELASFLDVSPRAIWQWEKGNLPHILTQEGAIARLSKDERLSQGMNSAIRCHSDGSTKITATADHQ